MEKKIPYIVGMRNELPIVQDIIIATAILHNITIIHNEGLPNEDAIQNLEDVIYQNNQQANNARVPFLDYYRTIL